MKQTQARQITLTALAVFFITAAVVLIFVLTETFRRISDKLSDAEAQNNQLTENLRISEGKLEALSTVEAQNSQLRSENDRLTEDLQASTEKLKGLSDTETQNNKLRDENSRLKEHNDYLLKAGFFSIHLWEYGLNDKFTTGTDPELTLLFFKHYSALQSGDYETFKTTIHPEVEDSLCKSLFDFEKDRVSGYSGMELRVMYSYDASSVSYIDPEEYCFHVTVLFREPGTYDPVNSHGAALGLKKHDGKWLIFYNFSGTYFPSTPKT